MFKEAHKDKNVSKPHKDHANRVRLEPSELIAGAVAGFAEHFVMFPFDTIKTRMQSGKDKKLTTAFTKIFRHERFAHLYRGCVPVLVSAIPAHAVYFGIYEATKRLFGHYGNIGIIICASFATIAHDAVSVPFDVVKQRMQMDGKRRFANSIECAKHVWRTGGVQSLFVSLPTTIVMNLPHFAAYWLVYESYMKFRNPKRIRVEEEEMTIDHMTGGFLAGAAASVVSFPFDTVKTQLQLGKGNSFGSALAHLLRERGVGGVFRGVLARMLYTAPSGAIMIVTYESMKRFLSHVMEREETSHG